MPVLEPVALEAKLDSLSNEERFAFLREFSKGDLAAVFEQARGYKPLTLAHFVPEGTALNKAVPHVGRNSLPLFRDFEKRFYRTSDGNMWGYNFQTMSGFTGPGYYGVHLPHREGHAEGELDVDYTLLPTVPPADGPEILSNHAKLGRFVYEGMIDVVRFVSNDVSIGRAMKGGKWMDAWFILARDSARLS